jgi:hypothetical protein
MEDHQPLHDVRADQRNYDASVGPHATIPLLVARVDHVELRQGPVQRWIVDRRDAVEVEPGGVAVPVLGRVLLLRAKRKSVAASQAPTTANVAVVSRLAFPARSIARTRITCSPNASAVIG